MPKQIFVNFPVSDVKRSIAFYSALGFTQNMDFSNEEGACMVWSEQIYFMLLNRDFYGSFLKNKTVADTHTTSGALIALSLENKEDVQTFADTAKANGGDFFKAGPDVSEDMMVGYEVTDPDGNTLEPMWMNTEFKPNEA